MHNLLQVSVLHLRRDESWLRARQRKCRFVQGGLSPAAAGRRGGGGNRRRRRHAS